MFILAFLCVLSPTTSFLIDVSTPNPPKAGIFITDEHYNVLMDFFMQERKSRQHLEKYVIQLNQRMTEMANDVASTKTKVGVLETTNSNVDLQEAFRALKNSSEIMKQAYGALLLEQINLKREVNVVTQRNNQLQIEVDGFKQLKTIVPLQSLANVNNFTVHLEKEIQSTNNMVNKVLSDGNARKQDFIALMNVTNVLKTLLTDTQLSLDQKFKDIEMKQNLTETSDHEFESKMDKINQTLTTKANEIENRLSTNIRNLMATSQAIMAKLTENNRRVALTACSNGGYVNSGDIVKFPDVKINYGIQNLTLFIQTGIFTCEQKGLYMFFSNIVSGTAYVNYKWYLNNSNSLSGVYVSNQNVFQSGSGMVTVELAVGDTVSFKSQNNNVRYDSTSCYTLIKIK